MKKILISNIGNRNLKYKGEFIDRFEFRDKTFSFFQFYEQEKEHLQLNILNVLLDEKKDEIEKVFLFASDQAGAYNHQDTLYEAGIIGRKINEIYELPVHVVTLKCSVVDNNELLRNFRNILKSIIRKYEGYDFILCDSGGTAQQKSSLKIMTEYLLPASRFRFYHITEQKDGPSKITEVNQQEYRKVIDTEQMSRLIEEGNYQGALSIHQQNELEGGREWKINILLQFAAARKAHLRRESMKYANPENWKQKEIEKLSFLEDYSNQNPAGKHYSDFVEFIEEDDFFYLCELLSIAEYCYELQDFNNATLFYSNFVESYLYSVIKLLGYDFFGYNHENEKKRLISEVIKDNNLIAVFTSYKLVPPQKGLPAYSIVCKELQKHPTNQRMMQNIFKVFSRLLNKNNTNNKKKSGLDGLRNSYAHRGLGISSDHFKQEIPGWEQIKQEWHQLLGMPEKNIFVQMNEAIIEYIR